MNLTLENNLHGQLLYDFESSLIIRPILFNYNVVNVSICDKLILKDYESKLEKLLIETNGVTKEKVICKSLTKSLQNTIGKLNFLSKPDSNLSNVEQNFDGNEKFEYLEELEIFKINGLDQIINVQEQQYSWQMLIDTTLIFAFGILQIIGGVLIKFYTVGIGTHISTGLISEGVSDIMFAIFAAKSGYFSWSNYFLHKIQSILITIVTVGIAGLISKGIRYSHFGSKIVGNTGKLSKMFGTSLIDVVSKSPFKDASINIYKQVWCQVGIKLAQGVAVGLANTGVSILSDKLLKGYCGKIITQLFQNVQNTIDKSKKQIHQSFKIIYQKFGYQKTTKWLLEINQTINSDAWYNTAYEYLKTFANAILNGISQGISKIASANGNSNPYSRTAMFINAFNLLIKGEKYLTALYNISQHTNNFINNMIKKIEEKAEQCQNEANHNENINEIETNTFIDKTTDEWCKSIEIKIDTDVRTKIIEPILCGVANKIIRKLGKGIKRFYKQRKENQLSKQYESVKTEYENKKNKLNENGDQQNQNEDREEILDKITKKYNQNLLIIMAKTKTSTINCTYC